MAEAREWTQDDLQALRNAVDTLERLGVWSVYVRGAGFRGTEVNVSAQDLIRISRLPGVTVAQPQFQCPNWKVVANAGGIAISCLMAAEELPAIGWRTTPAPALERLVEVVERVQPDAN